MNAKKIFLVASCTVMTANLGLAWRATRSEAQANTALADVVGSCARAQTDIGRANERSAAAERERAVLLRALDSAPPPVTAPKQPAPAPPLPNTMDFLRQEPFLHARWVDSQRATVAAKYSPVFRELNLSPDQIERFQEIKLRYEEQSMEVVAAMRRENQTQGQTSTETLAWLDQVKAEYQAAATELLGAAGWQILQEYKSRSPVRDIVRGFAGAAALAGTPLTAEQGEQLTQALADASWRYLRGGETDPQTIDWAVIDAWAPTILSDAQLKLFQAVEPEGDLGSSEGTYGWFSLRFGSQFNRAQRATSSNLLSAPVTKPPGR